MSDTAFVPGKLDTPEITARLRQVEALAEGDSILKFVQMQQCKMNDKPTFDREQVVPPIQLFDNLYFVGNPEVGCFIFKTSEGLIMVDSCFAHNVETILLPGMRELGLDPADVKYMLVTHTGPDHIGGAYYFQKHYGTRIVVCENQWKRCPSPEENEARIQRAQEPDFQYNPFDMRSLIWPNKDMMGRDGDVITLGDTQIQIVKTERMVGGGGLSYLATVYDHGTPHVWCTYGNTNVVGNLEDMALYRDNVQRFKEYVERLGADVVISSHPFVDESVKTMEQLRARKEGEPNPFVFGKERVARFFEILDLSAAVIAMRRELDLNEAGSGPYVPGVMDFINGSINPNAGK